MEQKTVFKTDNEMKLLLTTKQRGFLWFTFLLLNSTFFALLFSLNVDLDCDHTIRLILKKETGIWAIAFVEAALYGMSFLAVKIFDNEEVIREEGK